MRPIPCDKVQQAGIVAGRLKSVKLAKLLGSLEVPAVGLGRVTRRDSMVRSQASSWTTTPVRSDGAGASVRSNDTLVCVANAWGSQGADGLGDAGSSLASCRLCHRLQLRAGALWTADRCPAEWREPVDFQRGLCGVMILCHEANASLQPAWRPGSMLWRTAMPAPCSEWHRPSPVSTSAEVPSGSPADRLAWRRCSRCRIPLPLS